MIKRSFEIGSKQIGASYPAYLIAEIGINHEGDLLRCKEMVNAAQESGADCVKLQTIDPDENYVQGTISYEIFKKAWLTREETQEVFEYSKKLGVDIFTTAGDFKTLDWVETLDPCAYKISSGLLSSTPIVEHVLKKNKPLIISTGMSDLEEIAKNLQPVISSGRQDMAILHCTSLYPTPMDKVDLERIQILSSMFPYVVGFSDHSLGLDCSLWSIFSGAKIIERHFSFNKKDEGFDHKVSLEPNEFKELVSMIRAGEKSYISTGTNKELVANKKMYERSLIAGQDIKSGEKFTPENLKIKRALPQKRGMEPHFYHSVMGQTCKRNLKRDEPITEDVF